MLQNRKVMSEKDTTQTGKMPYVKPSLTSRGDILNLTQGGGPVPLDVQGTSLDSGAPS